MGFLHICQFTFPDGKVILLKTSTVVDLVTLPVQLHFLL